MIAMLAAIVCVQGEPPLELKTFTIRTTIIVVGHKPATRPAGALALADGIGVFEVRPGQTAVDIGGATIELTKCRPVVMRDSLPGVSVTVVEAGIAEIVNSGPEAVAAVGDHAAWVVASGGRQKVPCLDRVTVVAQDGQATEHRPPAPIARPDEPRWEWNRFDVPVRLSAAGGGFGFLLTRDYEAEVECEFVGPFNTVIVDDIEYDVEAFGVSATADFGLFDATVNYAFGTGKFKGDGTVIFPGPVVTSADAEGDVRFSRFSMMVGRELGGVTWSAGSIGIRTGVGLAVVTEKLDDVEVGGTPVDCSDSETYLVLVVAIGLYGRFNLGNDWQLDTRVGSDFDFEHGMAFGGTVGVSKGF